ncbi:MAG: 4-hydroxy-3-methylbut-2-enyl diphosphate reductase [Sediminibacterium sp. Gen4]|jgi:4-hydroxy-3-methylbut-2-en-1-yl diphosphate reductase|uniref:4-hydroxy-3-methylbut-2-enyl diphosphate reductase n=1 Tax=unclassified Sediminibacterium TaxID=2635961 RepID=UPI0015BA4D76|nr:MULTISPECIES: 4-hydroxy-3-methylbut-2-enyl diphosphate reductase [unclassified Sediminibacterium]MBW0161953.1 4-hydroxy-3-methylbut-2-enyl diphosphate reductase [Sediminibacterium sp.]MBW0165280.1 4-hydroxy-3-methylbut-2-enyl diphosphate reductase [Sediminibacterium sp.]NWK65070.1 4-hydroxy-3-methylbut-2-enyl diphosphate reductase [Sediminibacterium sp. Gen4]
MKQFNVPGEYRSPLIGNIKQRRKEQDKLKKDFSPTLLDLGDLQIYLARHFGFCYGVENAIEIAFRTIDENPGKRIFLLSEMIHNPQVNADLLSKGVQFLQDTKGKQLIAFDTLTKDDVVIIPAFGTTLEIEAILEAKGIPTEKYNTTCPFVEKVWNRSEQIAKKGYSIVVHGKPQHEETRATFSHASYHTPTVVVNDMAETIELAKYITGEKPAPDFYHEFKGRYSEGFDITKDLQKIGVVNQTTQLATDTQAISDYLKSVFIRHYQLTAGNIADRFADTRDTLCYATNDNQTAVTGMLADTEADIAIVIGGYNSSNSSHLVELCEEKLTTYFIDAADKLVDQQEIHHRNWRTKELISIHNYLPKKTPLRVLMTSGASCPDAVVEAVIRKLAGFYQVEEQLEKYIDA